LCSYKLSNADTILSKSGGSKEAAKKLTLSLKKSNKLSFSPSLIDAYFFNYKMIFSSGVLRISGVA
jgi:hypothetical protein